VCKVWLLFKAQQKASVSMHSHHLHPVFIVILRQDITNRPMLELT